MFSKFLYTLGLANQAIAIRVRARARRTSLLNPNAPIIIITTPETRDDASQLKQTWDDGSAVVEVPRHASAKMLDNAMAKQLPKGACNLVVVEGLYYYFESLMRHCYQRQNTSLTLFITTQQFMVASFIPYFRKTFSYLYADHILLADTSLANTFQIMKIPCSLINANPETNTPATFEETLNKAHTSTSNGDSSLLLKKYTQARDEVRKNSRTYIQMMPPQGVLRTLLLRFYIKNIAKNK